jgi:hypothetical protein
MKSPSLNWCHLLMKQVDMRPATRGQLSLPDMLVAEF